MKTLHKLPITLMVVAAVMAGRGALAAPSSNYWNGVAGNWNDTSKWTPNTVPVTTNNYVLFTNNVGSAYQISFTATSTSGPVRVTNDKVTFDLGGKKWVAYEALDAYSGDANSTHWISGNNGESSTLLFSSSGGNNGTADFVNGRGGNLGMQVGNYYGTNSLTIDNSLGNGVSVTMGQNLTIIHENLTIRGAGSELRHTGGGFAASGNIQILDGAYLTTPAAAYFGNYSANGLTTVTVSNARLDTGGGEMGFGFSAYMRLLTNSTWTSRGDIGVGNDGNHFYDSPPIYGRLLVDSSAIYGQNLTIGLGYSTCNGQAILQNGSTLVLSNGVLLVRPFAPVYTNMFVMDNSTIYLGRAGVNGALTNNGIMKASGTITGRGSNNFLFESGRGISAYSVTNAGVLEIGNNSLGQLVLNKGDLQLDPFSRTYLEFSATGLDQIVASNGFARLLGTNLFSIVGAQTPVHGAKFGLGVYDFVIGTSVSNAPQYDNLVNLLTNTYHLTYGVDFQYGVVNLGGGLFALELAFVPEPSTVLLLALGGLLAWRRLAKGRRKSGKSVGALVAGALVLALAGGSAHGFETTNVWTNAVNGTWSSAANWGAGTVPADRYTYVFWTNNAASAYTVQFTGTSTSGVVRVKTDKVTFDLNGNLWTSLDSTNPAADYGGASPNVSHLFGGGAGETCTVTFSSSTAGSNTFNMYSGLQHSTLWGNGTRNSSFLITTNLGYGVLVITDPNAGISNPNFTIEGPGSELRNPAPNIQGVTGNILVRDGGYFNWGGGTTIGGYVSMASTMMVNNAKVLINGYTYFGSGYQGVLLLTNNATFRNAGDIWVGYNTTYNPNDYHGTIRADGSQIYSSGGMQMGDGSANGQVYLNNGSTLALSNGWMWIRPNIYHPAGGGYYTNTFVLNNSTLNLGKAGTNGAITNQGIMRAAGTITGNGSGNFLLRNDGIFEVGSSIGTLTLNKGNFDAVANSRTYFEFGATGSDQIRATNGWVHLQGTNLFSLAAGAPTPVHGVKYGLGVYDFVITTNNNISTPQYDNLVNLLTNTYHLTYGVDFQYGVAALGGGLFALELTFVPEPSTVLLLALGGLMVWRRLAKRTSKRE